jgi:DNA-binding transcriptional MerR regulator
MPDYLIVRSIEEEEQPLYSRRVAADLARISREFLEDLEREQLISARPRVGGDRGYSHRDVRDLRRIRRLREDLDLDLPAVEVVLHMRQRMVEMLQEMEQIERQMMRREQVLRREIRQLQEQLAREGEWR